MATFTIRVELHDATRQNYIDMAADLARYGITDEVEASNGITYQMSPAEYNYVGNASLENVLDTVRACANKTGRANAVFVTEAAGRMWSGLQPARTRRTA